MARKIEPWYFKYIRRTVRQIFIWSPERRLAKKRASVGTELFRCEKCGIQPLTGKEKAIDHIIPCEDVRGFEEGGGWNGFITRTLGVTKEGLQILCLPCHKAKSKLENAERARYRREKKKNETKT